MERIDWQFSLMVPIRTRHLTSREQPSEQVDPAFPTPLKNTVIRPMQVVSARSFGRTFIVPLSPSCSELLDARWPHATSTQPFMLDQVFFFLLLFLRISFILLFLFVASSCFFLQGHSFCFFFSLVLLFSLSISASFSDLFLFIFIFSFSSRYLVSASFYLFLFIFDIIYFYLLLILLIFIYF